MVGRKPMSASIPEYYQGSGQAAEGGKPPRSSYPPYGVDAPAASFCADTFTLNLWDDWENETVYVLEGPVEDDLQHNITINVDTRAGGVALIDYADMQVQVQQETLKGCRLLMKGFTRLDNEMPAYRAIFVWYPTEGVRIYQDQVFVLHEEVGYKLTANFTKKTRKTIGPRVERIMLSFEPNLPYSLRS